MIVLAFDAALGGFSAALDDGTRVLSVSSGKQDALEHGLDHIAALLGDAGLRLCELDRIGVGLGPGSFTGVRIAVAYAKSLAYAAGTPLVGVSSYDALEPDAAELRSHVVPSPSLILTVVHGRRGVVCARARPLALPERAAADGVAADAARIACGPTAGVLDRLMPGPPDTVALAGNTEDVISQIAERGWTVRALPPRANIPAVAIAQLARTGVPSPSLHALAPDYGEVPAVTQPAAS